MPAIERPRSTAWRRALAETEIAGIQTTLPFHRFVAGEPGFSAAELSTDWVAEHWDGHAEAERAQRLARLAAALGLGALEARDGVLAQRQHGYAARDGSAGPWSVAALEAGVDRWPTT